MASKRRSFISLILVNNCITNVLLLEVYIYFFLSVTDSF